MRKILIITGLIMLLSVFGFSQKNKKSPNDAVEPQKSGENVLLESGTRLDAELQSTLDVKKSKVGDEVVLKTTKSIKQNGETIVPKGTSLIGRITEVQQKPKNGGMSKIAMVFDRIEGKNLDAPISASIVSIINTAANTGASDMINSDVSGSSSTSGNTRSSGGLLSGVTNTVGGAANTATQTVGGVTNTVTRTIGDATQTVGQTVNGIQISKSVSGSAQNSTTLSSANKNLRLEKGLTFQLRLNSSVEN